MIEWRGDDVRRKVEAAAKLGVDQTTAACVVHAKRHHPWQNRTGTLEGSIRAEQAERDGERVVARWGSFDVRYALWLEIGTRNMPAYPYLRPAADAEYPKLPQRIREALERG